MKTKNTLLINKKDKLLFLPVAIICFWFIDIIFKANSFGLGITVFYLFVLATSSYYLIEKKIFPSIFGIVACALSIVSSFSITLFNDEISQILMPFVTIGLYTIYCISFIISDECFGTYKVGISLLRSILKNPFKSMPKIVTSLKEGDGNSRKPISGIIGIIVSIPVLCAIIPLLVKSDAAFSGLVSNTFEELSAYITRIILAIIIFPYCYSYLFSVKKGDKNTNITRIKHTKTLASNGCVSFLSVISLTYLFYLFSQLAYFFSAFSFMLPRDYEKTASQFARKGFYEMCIVCAINILIISIVCIYSKSFKQNKAIKGLSLFILAFSILLVIIAMQKMVMNISIYGLSKNRILVFAFMLIILLTLVLFITHLFIPRLQYMKIIILFSSILLIGISYSNIDARIADYNIKAYNNNSISNLDINDISSLSDGAIPYLIELSKTDNSAMDDLVFSVRNKYKDIIKIDDNKIIKKNTASFYEINLAHIKAANEICEYYQELNEKDAAEFVSKIINGNASYNSNSTKIDTVQNITIYGNQEYSYFDYNGERYVSIYNYIPEEGNQIGFMANYTVSNASGEELGGDIVALNNDNSYDFFLLDTSKYSNSSNIVYTKLDLNYYKLLDILYCNEVTELSREQQSSIRNIFWLN